VEKNYRFYHFKGNTEEIVNSILSLLFGKEFYDEASLYSNFVNYLQPERYQKKIQMVLDLMQKENLILIRENREEGGVQSVTGKNPDKSNSDLPSEFARVYLRQHGKTVLSEGGYKNVSHAKKNALSLLEESVPLSSKIVILLILITALWYVI
jgi:hypothetical protein